MALPTEPITETVVASTDLITPVSPRVRWGGVMVVTLGVSIVGAMGGVPSLRRWRTPVIEARG
jgi:hypothetical protein